MKRDIENRNSRLKELMKKNNIEYALITNPINIYYYAGYQSDPMERFLGLIVSANAEKNSLIVPFLDSSLAKTVAYSCNISSYKVHQSYIEPLLNLIGKDTH